MCKSKDNEKNYRVKRYGEVFTPSNIVKDMCDLVKDNTYNLDCTFFEPSCGDGAFLVELLERKLSVASNTVQVYKAVSSIYGVDIQNDNVLKARKRMINICKGRGLPEDVLKGCEKIINVNIVHGNTLPDANGDRTMYFRGNMDDEYILMFYKWTFNDEMFTAVPTTIGDKDEDYGKRAIKGNVNELHRKLIRQIDVSKKYDTFAV